jgi:hypothetical protein
LLPPPHAASNREAVVRTHKTNAHRQRDFTAYPRSTAKPDPPSYAHPQGFARQPLQPSVDVPLAPFGVLGAAAIGEGTGRSGRSL